MALEFAVRGSFEAQMLMRESWPTHIISLIYMPCLGNHHLVYPLDDVEKNPKGNEKLATLADVMSIMKFASEVPDDARLLVHCEAGLSRSPAILLGALIAHGYTPEKALESLNKAKSYTIPNRLLVALIDQHFGLDGALKNAVERQFDKFKIDGIFIEYDEED
jgi:predicted protein tyrosine phosphatase